MMVKELRVRGRRRRSFQRNWRAMNSGIRALRHGDPLIAGLAHDSQEPQSVIAGNQAISVNGRDEFRVGKTQRALVSGDPFKMASIRAEALPEVLAQQPDIAVQVHRLVRCVREVDVTLSLE